MYLEDIRNITLYDIVQYINNKHGVNIRHNNVMRNMSRWLATPGFGMATQFEYRINTNQPNQRGGHQGDITTYMLNPRQSVAIAGSISMEYQLTIIDRLNHLETKYGETNTQNESMVAVSAYAKYLNDGILPNVANGILETIPTHDPVPRFYYADGKYLTGMNGYDYSTILLHKENICNT